MNLRSLEQAVCESTDDSGSVGKVPGATVGRAAPDYGTFTGGLLATNDRGTALVTDPSTLKVTLTNDRTTGEFTAKFVGDGTVKGTFSCS